MWTHIYREKHSGSTVNQCFLAWTQKIYSVLGWFFLLKIQNCKTTTILMFWQADEIVCLLSALSDSQVPRLASNGLESALERDAFSPKPSCSDNKPRRRTKCKILKINYAEELMTTFTWFSTSHCSGSQIVIDEPIIHWLNRLNRINDGSVV